MEKKEPLKDLFIEYFFSMSTVNLSILTSIIITSEVKDHINNSCEYFELRILFNFFIDFIIFSLNSPSFITMNLIVLLCKLRAYLLSS
jgi:hypothetical protein